MAIQNNQPQIYRDLSAHGVATMSRVSRVLSLWLDNKSLLWPRHITISPLFRTRQSAEIVDEILIWTPAETAEAFTPVGDELTLHWTLVGAHDRELILSHQPRLLY